jgi:peptidoglycan-associated lipoprotein
MDLLRTEWRSVLRVALVGVAATSLAACASRPKPAPLASTTPRPAAHAENAPPRPADVGESVLPGSERDFVINAGDRAYFDFDKYEVRADAQPILDAQAAWLNRYPAVRVRIEGNCDERGTREYNIALGARRASTVRDYLIAHGVSSNRITTVSYGKEKPIDPGASEQALAHDRNAHTTIVSGAT